MNRKRIKELADFLEDLPKAQFDMSNWVDETTEMEFTLAKGNGKGVEPITCDTSACIAGWAVLRYRPEYVDEEALDYDDEAGEILGIDSHYLKEDLFYGPGDATPQEGAQALRNVLANGDPDWNGIVEQREAE